MADRTRPRRDTAQDLTRSVVDLIRVVGGGGAARTPVTGTTGSSGGLLGTTTGANVTAGRIASTAATGTCDAKSHRSFRIVSNPGALDTMEVCVKLADDSYDWKTVTLT
jgi:predicted polyphosphate/ATP-dependent NAD kinase